MSIQRKSELVKLVVEVAPDKSVAATATYASGAWDGDKQEWVGQPHMVEEPFNSFAHDVSRLKGMVGPMFMQVAAAHEVAKSEAAAAKLGGTMQMQAELDATKAAHAGKVKELAAALETNGKLWKSISKLEDAAFKRIRNPILHRLTRGRAGR
jgi:hypothetical protein